MDNTASFEQQTGRAVEMSSPCLKGFEDTDSGRLPPDPYPNSPALIKWFIDTVRSASSIEKDISNMLGKSEGMKQIEHTHKECFPGQHMLMKEHLLMAHEHIQCVIRHLDRARSASDAHCAEEHIQ